MRQTMIVKKFDTGDNNNTRHGRYVEMETPELPEVGKTYMVWTVEYVGPDQYRDRRPDLCWSTDASLIERGFPGNSDHNTRRFHGWRGTSDDHSVRAHGVRQCTGVERREFTKSVHYTVSFGPDAKRDEA